MKNINEIVNRIIALNLIVLKVNIDIDTQKNDKEKIEKEKQLLERARDKYSEVIDEVFTNSEKEFFNLETSKVTSSMLNNYSWKNQSLAILMWSIGLIKNLKDADDGYYLTETIKTLDGVGYQDLLKTGLRKDDDLERARKDAEYNYWLARELGLSRKIDDKNRIKVFDKDINKLSKEEVSTFNSLSFERLFALNWICEYPRSLTWDTVTTDT